jgi:hypothetical protein
VVTKHIAVIARQRRLGTYKPTFDERLKEYNNKILEMNFNNMMEQNNKTFYPAIEQDKFYLPEQNKTLPDGNNSLSADNEEKKKEDEIKEDLQDSFKKYQDEFKKAEEESIKADEKIRDSKPIDFKLNKSNKNSNVISLDKYNNQNKAKKTANKDTRFKYKHLDLEIVKDYFTYLRHYLF